MSIESLHNYLRDLLAPTAVHACSEEEQRQVEEHVVHCDECRAEFDEHRRVAALLGATPALPPDSVWEKLSVQIQEPPPPVQLVRVKPRGLAARMLPIAAALALVVGGVVGGLTLATDETTTSDLASAARTVDGARNVSLQTSDGAELAKVTVLPNGQAYLYDEQLPSLVESRAYQLWAITRGTAVSAGTFGNDNDAVAFTVQPNVEVIAITDEIQSGALQPTATPKATASFA